MKTRLLNLVLAVAFSASATWASNLNLSVQQTNGTNAITVAPGAVVDYKVVGTLSDNLNRGLAIVGISLDFDLASPGGDLSPANSPPAIDPPSCANPMRAFDTPNGITNPPWPGGFGGTAVAGVLIQCCGAQNTIKNPNDGPGGAPDFPIGDVLLGVAKPSGCGPNAVLLTGSLTIPMGTPNGTYNLMVLNSGPNAAFANTIADDGSGADFYTTETAGINPPTNLAITVAGDVPRSFVSSVPLPTAVAAYPNPVPAGSTFWRSAGNVGRLTFDGTLSALPGAGQVQINELLPVPPGPAFGADVSASFAFSLENGPNGPNSVLRLRDGVAPATPTANLGHRKWYAIRGIGWTGVNNFEVHFPIQAGDATGDNRVLQSDILEINTGISCVVNCGDQNRKDITGDGRVLQADILEANTKISSLPVPKPVGH